MRSVVALDPAEARGLGVLLVGFCVICVIWLVALVAGAIYQHRVSRGVEAPINRPGSADAEYFRALDARRDRTTWPVDDTDADVVYRVSGWDDFNPADILEQLHRAADGDVTQRLRRWPSLAPLYDGTPPVVAPDFAHLIAHVGDGALEILDRDALPALVGGVS